MVSTVQILGEGTASWSTVPVWYSLMASCRTSAKCARPLTCRLYSRKAWNTGTGSNAATLGEEQGWGEGANTAMTRREISDVRAHEAPIGSIFRGPDS